MAQTPDGKIVDLIGLTFGKLTVMEYVGRTATKQPAWRAGCECGQSVIVLSRELVSTDTKSCGCLKKEILLARNRELATHWSSNTPEYRAWTGAKARCYNSSGKDYSRYGARGIRMCPQWLTSFDTFLADMGRRPSQQHSLDRINVNGNYSPENCRWSLPKEQALNRRSTKFFEGKCLADWAKELGITPTAVYKRVKTKGSVYG